VIFVNSLDPGSAWRRRTRKTQIHKFSLNRMPGHRKVGNDDGCGVVFSNTTHASTVVWVPLISNNSLPT
jgi:hypothetical protein